MLLPSCRTTFAVMLLGAATLSSCTRETKTSASAKPASGQHATADTPLVGTWEIGFDLGLSTAKLLRKVKPEITDEEVRAAEQEARKKSREAGQVPRMTFHADGTGLQEGMVFDHKTADPFAWELAEQSASRISIYIWNDHRPEKESMVFAIETPDLLKFAEGKMKGASLERVK